MAIFVFLITAWVIFSDIKCVSQQLVTTTKYTFNAFVAKASKFTSFSWLFLHFLW
jgi:hypothetical protein